MYGLAPVLEYFERPLTRPHRHARQHTYGFFNQNVVMEYPRAQAVADGVNCDYEVWRICSTSAAVSGPTVAPQRMMP